MAQKSKCGSACRTRRRIAELISDADDLLAGFDSLPVTLAHHDPQWGNLFAAAPDEWPARTVAIDWGFIGAAVRGSSGVSVSALTHDRRGHMGCRRSGPPTDAFQRRVCHTSKRMSCQTPGIRRGSEAQRRGKGTPSRRQVTYVPHDPSFEMPAEDGALTNA